MKASQRLLNLMVLLTLMMGLGNDSSFAQIEHYEGDYDRYHYASATAEKNGRKFFYISEIAKVTFIAEYDYSTDPYLKSQMEREFLEYLRNSGIYGDNQYSFVAYSFSDKKKEIENIVKVEIKKYQQMGFTIKRIKGFVYD